MVSRLSLELTAIVLLLLLAVFLIIWQLSLPRRAGRVVHELCGVKNEDRPRLRRIWRTRYTWRLAWRMPTLATASRFLSEREAIETRLNCSVEIWERGGLVRMRFGVNPLPRVVRYEAFYGG